MKRARTSIVLLLSLALAATLFAAGPGSAAPVAGPALPATFDREILAAGASPRAIVGFRHDVDAATIRRLSAVGITHAVRLDTIDAVGVLGPVASYAEIAAWSDVTYVDADSPIRWDNYAAKDDTKVTQVRQGAKPLKRPYTGAGVTVAVVDTGIDSTHPDLAGRVVKDVNFEPAWVFDMIHDGLYSDQLVEGTGNPIDTYGHGTHVAGIVGGSGAAAQGDADYTGVAPGASLVNLKIADIHEGLTCDVPCDFGWEINALVAFEWMIENRDDPEFPGGIRVSTNSWSIYEVDSEVEPIVLITREAVRAGITVLFAAGNDGPDEDTVGLGPNALPEVITVAAACKSVDSCTPGAIAEFSSRGRQVDVAAPGDSIWSARAGALAALDIAFGVIFGPFPPPPGGAEGLNNLAFYIPLSGTSMSCPHVAGVVALMLEANPKLTPAQVQTIIKATAKDMGTKGFDTTWGAGLVDAFAAVKAAIAPKPKKKPAKKK